MNAPSRAGLPALNLKDPKLFREQCYIDGAWVGADSNKSFPVDNPASGEAIGSVPDMGVAETRRAIEAADKAWPAWRAKTAKERAAILRKWFDLMMANQDDLALILTTEQGKPLAEAKGEIAYGASFVEWFAEEAKRVYGDVIPPHQADKRILVLKQPIGVAAMITPWNFPNAMITRKAAPALAAGCTVVIKPAEQTPFSALAMAELAERAGMPKGVFNLVTGDAPTIGKEMCANPTVRKLSFTGSTEVGRILMRQSADTIKKLSLELGGNAPFIVFDDADLDAAVEGAIASKYRNAGQTCVCANRIYVQDKVYDTFAAKLAEKVKQFKVGAGTESGVVIGPLIDRQGMNKVEQHVADATAKGAKVILGGKPHSRGGLFFEPTILTGVTQQMRVSNEETFGPVAPLYRFKTEDEAIAMANATEFGLSGYFYSRDIGRIFRVAEKMETGMVCVNSGILSTEVAPFGGVKQSGLGREGSKYGIEEYLEVKYLMLGGI
ncbi:MAG TPA: NADP-dependent succinate-semialdehyde dehydrogenase [Burkholderiales bacterium]|nr:NADP-dependent succinate-semialdehyde dehydrogenase [Burkholderiales bacterium]